MPHLHSAELHLQAVLFDFANTLVPTKHVGPTVFVEVVEKAGFDAQASFGDFERCWGRFDLSLTLRDVMTMVAGPQRSADMTNDFWKVFTTRSLTTPETTGASAMLNQLQREGTKAALVSQVKSRDLDAQLSVRGWKQLFSTVLSLEDVVVPKPHPHGHRTALTRLGVSPSNAVAIESSSNGLKAAASAGLTTIHIGCSNEAICREDADFHARDFIDIEFDELSATA